MILLKKTFIVSTLLLLNTICNISVYADDTWKVQIQGGVLSQKYQEIDDNNLTSKHVLNSEKGQLPHIQISVLNTLGATYGELNLAYAQGNTDYNGYLQSNGKLVPYQAETTNNILRSELIFGFAKKLNHQVDFKTFVKGSYYNWERALVKYNEKFDHTAVLLGVGIDWNATNHPVLLEATAAGGYIVDSHIQVDKFDFNQYIGGNAIWQAGVSSQYVFPNNVGVKAAVEHTQWKYDKSTIENNYQYLGSSNQQTSLNLGLNYTY